MKNLHCQSLFSTWNAQPKGRSKGTCKKGAINKSHTHVCGPSHTLYRCCKEAGSQRDLGRAREGEGLFEPW